MKKTLKAYRIDLRQFSEQFPIPYITEITASELENYIAGLHQKYKPKTAKRKIASIKALFHYLEYREIIVSDCGKSWAPAHKGPRSPALPCQHVD